MNDNQTTAEFLGGQVTITANSDREVVIVSDDEGIVINRMPIEFRIWVSKNSNDKWMCSSIFAYRVERQAENHPQKPATDNQRLKLYRAAIEAVEQLEESVLHGGKIAAARREMETAARRHEETRERLIEATQKYEAALAENIV